MDYEWAYKRKRDDLGFVGWVFFLWFNDSGVVKKRKTDWRGGGFNDDEGGLMTLLDGVFLMILMTVLMFF